MQPASNDDQIPKQGPLAVIKPTDATGEAHTLQYGGQSHLRNAYKIPIALLHFNIENGRYATKFQLLRRAYPGVTIDPREVRWSEQILALLNGMWTDPNTGASTSSDRTWFEQLIQDIQARGQERPGVVIENGAVMSGNRRLAALITLSKKRPDVESYKYFNAFIVPGEHGMTEIDRWRLEISQQMGQGRLMRDYSPIDRLIKIREGIQGFIATGKKESEAIEAVAFDFGSTNETIQADLASLKHIDDYLRTIGDPDAYWLIEGKTEIFTEIEPLQQAMSTNNMPLEHRGKIKATLYDIISNGNGDYGFLRQVRRAVGPTTPRRRSIGTPQAVDILIQAAPTPEQLKGPTDQESKSRTSSTREAFESELQAAKEEEAPLVKAQRAESNLRAVSKALGPRGTKNLIEPDKVKSSLKSSQRLAKQAIDHLAKNFKDAD